VAGWNPTTESYDKLYYVGISPPMLDFDIDPCKGYWISAVTAETLTLRGYQSTGQVYTLVDVPAGGGWALLGVPSLEEGLMASEIAAMYAGEVTAVAAWNAATQMYQTYYPGTPTDFVVSPGRGVWLMCAEGAWFTYAAA